MQLRRGQKIFAGREPERSKADRAHETAGGDSRGRVVIDNRDQRDAVQ
jgi:hypothetical protein